MDDSADNQECSWHKTYILICIVNVLTFVLTAVSLRISARIFQPFFTELHCELPGPTRIYLALGLNTPLLLGITVGGLAITMLCRKFRHSPLGTIIPLILFVGIMLTGMLTAIAYAMPFVFVDTTIGSG